MESFLLRAQRFAFQPQAQAQAGCCNDCLYCTKAEALKAFREFATKNKDIEAKFKCDQQLKELKKAQREQQKASRQLVASHAAMRAVELNLEGQKQMVGEQQQRLRQLDQVEQENEELTKQLKAQTKEAGKQRNQKKLLNGELDRLSRTDEQATYMEKQNQELLKALEAKDGATAAASADEKDRKIAELNGRLDAVLRDLTRYANDFDKQDERHEACSNRVRDLLQAQDKAQATEATLKTQIQALEQQVHTSQKCCTELAQEVQAMKKCRLELAELKEQLQKFEKQAHDIARTAASKKKEKKKKKKKKRNTPAITMEEEDGGQSKSGGNVLL